VANPFDVAARLSEARPTIDDVEEYVAACRRLGYQHRDLTVHPTQVRDWYDAEEGLDLRALDLDHGILAAAASAAEDAARRQGDLVAELAAAWSGRGAAAAHEFVSRSCQAATAVSAAVRAAADAEAALRDALWQAVDAKAAATEAVGATAQPQRAEWLAAAKTVTTGAGDVAAASELIDLQVKPFVDRDVGSDWLSAMRAAVSSIDAAFDAAIARATAPAAVFGVPGDLGPRAESPGYTEAAGGGEAGARAEPSPVRTAPAAAFPSAPAPAAAAPSVAPASAAPAPMPPWSPPAETAPMAAASAPLPPSAAAPSMPSPADLGAGTSSLGSGLSGFGQQLADLIGGLIGSADGELPDAADTSEQDEPETDAESEEPADDEDATAAVEDPEEPAEEIVEEPAPQPPPTDPEPTSTPAPLPPEPPPAPQGLPEAIAEAVPDGTEPTPCEIAADELPQVGE
jgi:hypothetical protein